MASSYAYTKALRAKKTKIVKEYRESNGCARCGEKHPAVLDLHHLDPSTKHWMLTRKSKAGKIRSGGNTWRDLSFEGLQEEFAKCEVLCSNCHRKETHTER